MPVEGEEWGEELYTERDVFFLSLPLLGFLPFFPRFHAIHTDIVSAGLSLPELDFSLLDSKTMHQMVERNFSVQTNTLLVSNKPYIPWPGRLFESQRYTQYHLPVTSLDTVVQDSHA